MIYDMIFIYLFGYLLHIKMTSLNANNLRQDTAKTAVIYWAEGSRELGRSSESCGKQSRGNPVCW